MAMKNFSVIILLLSFSLVSCHKDSFADSLISGRLKIIDDITEEPRINEAVTLNFISNSGERYSSTRNTDDSGYIYFKGNPNGKYIASFSYYSGTANDCFMEFAFSGSSKEQEFIMNVAPSVTDMDTDVVITGYMADVAGSDNGYEYMQFMALKDIDFSVEPYCVIACRNNAVTAAGWVQGSYVTYKFNLVSGSVSRGEFFYVGGINKNLNGAGSADISSGNWICSVDYTTQPGADGIGDSTVGFLHNANSNSNNNIADGIAVFKGTEVTPDTEPCDVVFYGALINSSVYNPAGWGYTITDNDLYSTVDRLTGASQKYFGQGTNTYLFKDAANDAGEFTALGGIFSSSGYVRGRSATYIPCPSDPSEGSIELLEKGEGVTEFIEIKD